METQYVDLDIVDAVNMADEKKLHHLHSHNHADHSHSSAITSEITPNNDDDDGDDGDNEVDVDQTTYMNGISWPNPEWETETSSAKLLLLKLLWILSFPLSLTRWVSIPSTETRPDFLVSVKRVFFFISPFFLSLFLLFTITDGYQYDPEDKLLWILLPSIGCGVSILLFIFYSCIVKPRVAQYHDTRAQLRLEEAKARRNDANNLSREELSRLTALHIEYELDNDDDCEVKPTIMSFYQIIISLLAFISAIAWLSFISDEIVGLLGSLGLMFNISSSLLGLTVLALGNSLPDLIAGMSLAAKGKIGVSYAAIFGAPVLSSTFGFGLGLLIKFVKDQSPVDILDRVVTFDVGAQLWLSFGATIFGVILHCIVFPFSGYTPTKRYGIALICLYLLFLAAAVVFEVTS
jgi:Ca2+/Na+ antiporter